MERFKAHLALIGANLIYGINYSVAKSVMPTYIEPLGFILLRVIGALLLFWSLSLFTTRWEPIEKKDWGRIVLAGLFGVALNQMLFFKGLNLTQPINASIIMTTNPILVLIISAILLKERISLQKIVGISLGLVGAVLLILFKGGVDNPSISVGTDTALGDLLVLLNALSYGVYLVIVKPLMSKYKAVTVLKLVFLFGFCFVLPFGMREFTAIEWSALPTEIIWAIVFVVVGTTFFSYLLNIYALQKVSSTSVSIYIYSQPFFATLVALSFGQDELTATKIVATALIFTGVYLVTMKKKAKEKAINA